MHIFHPFCRAYFINELLMQMLWKIIEVGWQQLTKSWLWLFSTSVVNGNSMVGFRTNTPKIHPFHYRGLECKSRKSRNTWSNRQIWPWSTERGRAKANRVLPRERSGHSKHSLPTTQDKILQMDITRWATPKSDWLYSLHSKMEKLYTVRKKQDQEPTVAQIMNSLLPNSNLNEESRENHH